MNKIKIIRKANKHDRLEVDEWFALMVMDEEGRLLRPKEDYLDWKKGWIGWECCSDDEGVYISKDYLKRRDILRGETYVVKVLDTTGFYVLHETDYEAFRDDKGDVVINGVVVNDKIFNEELVGYILRDREDLVENLCLWISESTRESDKNCMLMDLRYLINLKDDYVFSSISTNKYIAQSDREKEFNEICQEVLDLDAEFRKKF
jgi:hypothetical protein